MADRLVRITDTFWNIRGSFKLGGLLDIGTQASLARLESGRFVMLDAYTLQGSVKDEIFALTDGGAAIEAVLHLHPFHTIHVERIAEQLPHAVHYGSTRHRTRAPAVSWSPLSIESPELAAHFAADFRFSVPAGVPLISLDERLHFSSVLAYHRASRTLHVDDTLTWSTLPLVGGLVFHPTLAKVLERRPGAVAEFRAWAHELIELCAEVDHLVTAHMRALPPDPRVSPRLHERVRDALRKVEPALVQHERRWG